LKRKLDVGALIHRTHTQIIPAAAQVTSLNILVASITCNPVLRRGNTQAWQNYLTFSSKRHVMELQLVLHIVAAYDKDNNGSLDREEGIAFGFNVVKYFIKKRGNHQNLWASPASRTTRQPALERCWRGRSGAFSKRMGPENKLSNTSWVYIFPPA